MNIKEIRANLKLIPLAVKRIFFDNDFIRFRPSPNNVETVDLFKGFHLETALSVINEEEHLIQVRVRITSGDPDNDIFSFDVSCIGQYEWRTDEFNEDIVKRIYTWAIAVQMGSIRQHIAEKTANGPFGMPIYLPIALVNVTDTAEQNNT